MQEHKALREKYRKDIRSRWKFNYFFFKKLPSVVWWKVRVKHIDDDSCEIRLPFTWRSQNPFKSVYFGAQAGASELTTGLMILAGIQGLGKVSFLVTGMSSRFYKKAKGDIIFTCKDGQKVLDAHSSLKASGDKTTIEMTSQGHVGDLLVSEFVFTWDLKRF